MAAGVRIFEIIDLKPEVKDADKAVEMPTIEGRVQYEHVNFHYVPGVEVLKDVNLEIEPGETVALVGATGAGKSTFVTLLLRFADVTGGKHKDRRPRPEKREAPVCGEPDEHGASGTISVHRHRYGEHPILPRRGLGR